MSIVGGYGDQGIRLSSFFKLVAAELILHGDSQLFWARGRNIDPLIGSR